MVNVLSTGINKKYLNNNKKYKTIKKIILKRKNLIYVKKCLSTGTKKNIKKD